jgi:tRNA modification GTPase
MNETTIAALATPAGTGGICIIKISGPSAISIARAIFKPAAPKSGCEPESCLESHRLYYGHVVDPASGCNLDEVLLSVMKAPRSYTREDVVEINAHGGPVAAREIIKLVLDQGARLAEPGEFTRRAFLNGRIDLTQAEAVVDLIQARTARFLQSAAAQAGGVLRQDIERVREACTEALVCLNASIDFPEDVGEISDNRTMASTLQARLIAPLARLLQNYSDGRVLREGLTVVIVGRPNVGKSSLMNRLLSRERAIVTPHPGTTRDIIEDNLILRGIPVSLADTAGIHDSPDPVEVIGMQKALEQAQSADLILLVLEANRPLSGEDAAIFEKIRSKPVFFVLNKTDLLGPSGAAVEFPSDWPIEGRFLVSALNGQGVEALRDELNQSAGGANGLSSVGSVIPNLRQKIVLERCLAAASDAVDALGQDAPAEIIAIHLSDVMDGCAEILGTHVKVDLLESIFSRFCIGK